MISKSQFIIFSALLATTGANPVPVPISLDFQEPEAVEVGPEPIQLEQQVFIQPAPVPNEDTNAVALPPETEPENIPIEVVNEAADGLPSPILNEAADGLPSPILNQDFPEPVLGAGPESGANFF